MEVKLKSAKCPCIKHVNDKLDWMKKVDSQINVCFCASIFDPIEVLNDGKACQNNQESNNPTTSTIRNILNQRSAMQAEWPLSTQCDSLVAALTFRVSTKWFIGEGSVFLSANPTNPSLSNGSNQWRLCCANHLYRHLLEAIYWNATRDGDWYLVSALHHSTDTWLLPTNLISQHGAMMTDCHRKHFRFYLNRNKMKFCITNEVKIIIMIIHSYQGTLIILAASSLIVSIAFWL